MNCNNTPKCEKPCGDCPEAWPVPAGSEPAMQVPSPAEGDELPPLPKADVNIKAGDWTAVVDCAYYTADQMRAYGIKCAVESQTPTPAQQSEAAPIGEVAEGFAHTSHGDFAPKRHVRWTDDRMPPPGTLLYAQPQPKGTEDQAAHDNAIYERGRQDGIRQAQEVAAAQPSIQDLAAGAHYPQVTAWQHPAPHAAQPVVPSPCVTVAVGAGPAPAPAHLEMVKALPLIDEDDRKFLHYNPNTSDLVEFVQNYAIKVLANMRSYLAAEVECNIFERYVSPAFERFVTIPAQPEAAQAPAVGADLPPLPKVGPIGFASVVDVDAYAPWLKIGPHLPGVRDVALWTTDQMRAYARAALSQPPVQHTTPEAHE